jgi:hypothetical protein
MINDREVQSGIQAQARSMGNKPVDSNMVKNAFELNKGKLDKSGLDKTSPEYWAQVAGNTEKDLGLFSDENDPFNISQSQKGMKPKTMFKQESYVRFEQALEEAEKEEADNTPKAMSRIDAAKDLVKKLKKFDVSKNQIINSLVNQIGLDINTALSIYNKEEVDKAEWSATDPLTPNNTEITNDYCETQLEESKKKSFRKRS